MKKLFLLFAVSSLLLAKPAPLFQGEMLGGGQASLTKILNESKTDNKLLLLAFWASWCQPCMQELKTVTAQMATESSLPLKLLTVNVDTSETASDVKPTLKLYKFEIPVVLDPKHEIFGKYQEAKNLPYSVLINSKGEIVSTFTGYDENMFATIRKAAESEKK